MFFYISFCKSNTRSSSMGKLKYVYKRLSTTRHFYFNRIVRIWNQLPFLDLTLSFNSLKSIVIDHLWNHFVCNFNSFNVCSYHFICPCNNCHLKSSFYIILLVLFLLVLIYFYGCCTCCIKPSTAHSLFHYHVCCSFCISGCKIHCYYYYYYNI